MRKHFFLSVIMTVIVFMTGCQAIEEIREANRVDENDFIELTNPTGRKIVSENLDRIQMVLTEYHDEALMSANNPIITEDILDEKKDTEAIENLLKPYRGAFQALVAEENLEKLMRTYVYEDYTSIHGSDLSPQKMHVRFEIEEQTADQFTATFIELADEAYHPLPTKYRVSYIKMYNEWLLHSYESESVEDGSLELTVHDIKEYYQHIHLSEAELVDSPDNYLVFRVTPSNRAEKEERYFVAINIHDSLFDDDLAAEYEK